MRAVIAGTGRSLGEGTLTNAEVVRAAGLDPDRPAGAGGWDGRGPEGFTIRRRIVDPAVTTGTMCAAAGREALARAGVEPAAVDLVICVTDTPDFLCPATAARVQAEVGAVNAGFFDLNSACAGFTMALAIGSNLLRCDETARAVLVTGGNAYSRFVRPDDLAFNLLFSDGAGAMVLTRGADPDHGIRAAAIRGLGEHWARAGIFAGGAWKGFTADALANGEQYLRIVDPYPPDINVHNWPLVIDATLAKTGWTPRDVDRVFFTQSNRRNILAACAHFGWDPAISYDTAPRFGYLGSACVPVAFDDAIAAGALRPGERILICTSGFGASYSGMTLVWGP